MLGSGTITTEQTHVREVVIVLMRSPCAPQTRGETYRIVHVTEKLLSLLQCNSSGVGGRSGNEPSRVNVRGRTEPEDKETAGSDRIQIHV